MPDAPTSPELVGRVGRAGAWARRVSPLVSAMVIVGVVRLVYFLLAARHVPMSGDEASYHESASRIVSIIGSLLRGHGWDGDAASAVIDRGWFMPGMSTILAPVAAVTKNVAAARAWVGLLVLVVLCLVGLRLARLWGRRLAAAFVLVVGLFPTTLAFSFHFWGEAIGGLLAVALLLVAWSRFDDAGRSPARVGLALGVLLTLTVYVRPSYIVLLPVVVLLVVFDRLNGEVQPRPALGQAAVSIVVLAVVFAAVLAPWSVALSRKAGGTFLTTTSIDLGVIVTFGSEPAAPDDPSANQYHGWYARLTREAAAQGITYGEALRAQRDRVLDELTLSRYLGTVGSNIDAYFLRPNQFLDRFGDLAEQRHPGAVASSVLGVLAGVNRVLWPLLLLAAGVAMVAVVDPRAGHWPVTVGAKLGIAALSIQPFLVGAHGRYHVGMIPLLVVLLGSLVSGRARLHRWRGQGGGAASGIVVQVGLSVLVLVLVTLAVTGL